VVLAEALSRAGADDWTQSEARRWWETTFTPSTGPQARIVPATEFVEVAAAHGMATS
jgi:hypothetical protein